MPKFWRFILILSALCLLTKTAQAKKSFFETEKLKNDLEIVMLPSSKVPIVTIVLTVKAGGMTEKPSTNGLTHLWEHMFFKGNQKLKNQEAFNKRIRQLGISYNGDTAAEKVRYYFTLPSANLAEGIEFMANAIQSPLINQEELEKERKVVLNEYDRSASQPHFKRQRLKNRLIYGKLDYLRDPLGERPLIANAQRKQLLQMKDEVFVPANSALLIAGDFTRSQIMPIIKKFFSNWKNPAGWKPIKPPPFQPFPQTQEFVMTHPQATNASVSLTFAGPKARTEQQDSFAADILISLLSLRTGKFYQAFTESGLSFHSGLGYYTQSQTGEINLYATTTPEKATVVKNRLLNEISTWTKPGYFTEEQLSDVRRSLRVEHKFELNRPSAFIKGLGFWWAVAGLDYYGDYLENLAKVELKDIYNFVKSYLVDKPYVGSILMSPKNAEKIKMPVNGDKLWQQHFAKK